jgi:hypothetical protein
MPYISLPHGDGICSISSGECAFYDDVRHRNMEIIYVNPAAYIIPNLNENVRVVLTAPDDIRRTGIEMEAI